MSHHATSAASVAVPQVVTITVEKAGGAAVDATFLTPDVIERANALVVTHGRPTVVAAAAAAAAAAEKQESAEDVDEGTEILIEDIAALFGDEASGHQTF